MPVGDGSSISVVGGEDIAMPEQSENKEAAAEFIRYMLPKVQLQWAEKGQMPASNLPPIRCNQKSSIFWHFSAAT